MPKSRVRKRGYTTQHSNSQAASQKATHAQATISTRRRAAKATNPRAKAAENLVMPSLVALGCWGLAFSFIFLTNEANHYLFGGMAVVMAVMWSIIAGMRLVRMRQVRQNVNQ